MKSHTTQRESLLTDLKNLEKRKESLNEVVNALHKAELIAHQQLFGNDVTSAVKEINVKLESLGLLQDKLTFDE